CNKGYAPQSQVAPPLPYHEEPCPIHPRVAAATRGWVGNHETHPVLFLKNYTDPVMGVCTLSGANNNQLAGTNQAPGGIVYDAAGDVTNDGVNQYLYDGEGRVSTPRTKTCPWGP